MRYNQDVNQRRSIRLKGYDYSQEGLYFITICTQNKLCLFGEIKNGEIVLNDSGIMIKTVWQEIPIYYHEFNIHQFVIMPNHIHGIIEIINDNKSVPVGAGPCACPNIDGQQKTGQPQGVAPTMSLSDIVHRFKTMTTNEYVQGVKNNNLPGFNKKFWQRNYYEHIIRNEKSSLEISEYIINNPLNWQDDKYYV
jgi:REP element-mobilizing transposase RayT